MDESNILEVKDLLTTFRTERGLMKAVDGVSFQVKKGEILGVVGESGCGKSVTSQSIMRLYDEKRTARYSGEILLNGDNLLKKTEKEMREIRGRDVAMVFQDALSSLNPVIKIGEQIMEPLRIYQYSREAQALAQEDAAIFTPALYGAVFALSDRVTNFRYNAAAHDFIVPYETALE